MAAKPTRRCHWVPQAYLKAFASDDKKSKIWRSGKDRGEPEQKPIDKVAVRFHLYSPKKADGTRDDSLEKKFAELENFFMHSVWSDFSNDFVDLSHDGLRKNIALVIATTWLRTPNQFDAWKAMHVQFADFYSEFGAKPADVNIGGGWVELDHTSWPSFRDASEEEMKAAWNGSLAQCWSIAEMLLDMRWSVVFHDKPAFITSDNPVAVGDLTQPFRGLKHADTVVTFPISPTRFLRLDRLGGQPGNQYYQLDHSPAATNYMTWMNSIEHIFSSQHPEVIFTEIDEAMSEYEAA